MQSKVLVLAAAMLTVGLGGTTSEVRAQAGVDSLGDTALFMQADNCITWPQARVAYGEVDIGMMRTWTDGVRYVVNSRYLRVVDDLTSKYGGAVLEQRMIPASNGSPRVVAAIDAPASQTRIVTQSFRVPNNFDWGGQYESGKMGFGIGGGSVPTGGKQATDGFSARLIWMGSHDGTAQLGVYVYSSDRSQNLPWGDIFLVPDFQIPQGEWFDVSLVVSANSTIGQSDGWFSVAVNDEVKLHRDGIQWQSSGDARPVSDKVSYATFYGGADSRWAPSSTTTMRFANVCYSS